jgi:hypothetical protein
MTIHVRLFFEDDHVTSTTLPNHLLVINAARH